MNPGAPAACPVDVLLLPWIPPPPAFAREEEDSPWEEETPFPKPCLGRPSCEAGASWPSQGGCAHGQFSPQGGPRPGPP